MSIATYTKLFNASSYEELDALITRDLKQNPLDVSAWYFRAQSQKMQMRYGQALAAATKVLELEPLHMPIRPVWVVCAAQVGLVAYGREKVKTFEFENQSDQRCFTAMLYRDLACYEDALNSVNEVIEAFPGDPYPVQVKGTIEMSMGLYDQGIANLRQYVSREFFRRYLPDSMPQKLDLSRYWCGEDLTGKHVQIVPHGGVGDMVQFLRYAKCLRELGAQRVGLLPPNNRIAGLLGSFPGIDLDTEVSKDSQVILTDPYGLWLNMYPKFGFQATQKYLEPVESPFSKEMVGWIRRRAGGQRLMGLSWCSDMRDGAARTVPLSMLLPLFAIPGIHWVIFQRGWALKEFERSPMAAQCSVVPESATFDEAAAIVLSMQAIVTVESFMTHLAGAIGVPVYFLASRSLDWRHGNAQSQSPWYPHTTILRQSLLGDWNPVVNQLLEILGAGTSDSGALIHGLQSPAPHDPVVSTASPYLPEVRGHSRVRRTLFVDCTGLNIWHPEDEALLAIGQLVQSWSQVLPDYWCIRVVWFRESLGDFGEDEALTQALLACGVETNQPNRGPVSADAWLIAGAKPSEILKHQSYYAVLQLQGIKVLAFIHDLSPVFSAALYSPEWVGQHHMYARLLMSLQGAFCFCQKVAKDFLGLAQLNSIELDPDFRLAWTHPGVAQALSWTSNAWRQADQTSEALHFVTYANLDAACGLEELLDAFTLLWQAKCAVTLCVLTPTPSGSGVLIQRLEQEHLSNPYLRWHQGPYTALPQIFLKPQDVYIGNRLDAAYSLPLVQARATGVRLLLRSTHLHRELAGQQATFFQAGGTAAIVEAVQMLRTQTPSELANPGGQTGLPMKTWQDVARHFFNAI